MNYSKKVIGHLNKCYSLTTFKNCGEDFLLCAAEKQDPCFMFDLNGKQVDCLWEEPGGVMSMEQVPLQEGVLLATQRFYSPNDSADAQIVYVRKKEGKWTSEVLCKLPFVHRFGILKRGKKYFLVAATIKSAHEFKEDWTCPGRIWAAELPEDLTQFDSGHLLNMKPVLSGLYHNHGFFKYMENDNIIGIFGSDNGVFKLTPPLSEEDEWEVEKLLDVATSDMIYLDFDNDGDKEILTFSPFHGSKLRIYKKINDNFEVVYEHKQEMPFLHAIWGCEIQGVKCAIIGNREGNKELIRLFYDAVSNKYQTEIIDTGAGPANVLCFKNGYQTNLIAANRETNEIALYMVE